MNKHPHLEFGKFVLPEPKLFEVHKRLQPFYMLKRSKKVDSRTRKQVSKHTLILFPPSSRLVSDEDRSSPVMCDIRFCTKYAVFSDGRRERASGMAFNRLNDRSKVLQ